MLMNMRLTYPALAGAGLILTAGAAEAAVGDKPEAHGMALVGYNDLQARSACRPVIHAQNASWIASIGRQRGAARKVTNFAQ